jgi:hypothetical protein
MPPNNKRFEFRALSLSIPPMAPYIGVSSQKYQSGQEEMRASTRNCGKGVDRVVDGQPIPLWIKGF